MEKLMYHPENIPLLRWHILLMSCLLLSACGLFKSDKQESPDESFDNFYRQFHSNMDFQKDRVQFPLDGYRMDNDGKTEWTRENYELHRSTIGEVDREKFEIKIIEEPNKVKEIIYAEGTGFYFSRTFRKINGLWYLTSCTDENL